MLKSLNELYGVKKQQNAHPALAHEVKTSHTGGSAFTGRIL